MTEETNNTHSCDSSSESAGRARLSNEKRAATAESIAVGISFMLILTVVQRAVGLVRSVLFCRLMPEEELGLWALANSFFLIAAPIAVLGLPGCFGRYVERYRMAGQFRRFLTRIALVSGVSSLILLLGALLAGNRFTQFVFRSDQGWLNVWVVATLAAVIVSNALIELMNGLRQVRVASVMRLVQSVCFALIGIVLIFANFHGAFAAMVGTTAGCIAASFIAILFLFRSRTYLQGEGSHEPSAMWSTLIPFAAWLWLMDLLSNLIEVSDRYMLLHFVPGSDQQAQALIGQYHSSLVIPIILVGLGTMVGGALLPHFSRDWELGHHASVGRKVQFSVKCVIFAFSLVASLCLLCAPLFYDVLLAGRYATGSQVLPYTFANCIWLASTYLAMNYLWCAEKGKWANFGMVGGVIVNVAFNALLIPQWGLQGAVMATGFANLTLLGLTLLVCRRFGMQVGRPMGLIALFPALLIGGPLLVPMALIWLACSTTLRSWFFSDDEQAQFISVCEKMFARAQGLISRLRPNRQRPNRQVVQR